MRTNVTSALKDLVAAVEHHTDCMTNQVERAALDPFIDRAFQVLAECSCTELSLYSPGEPAQSELIEWFLPELSLPDSDTTVLIIAGGDVEAWPGYLDGDEWRNAADGMPVENVVYRAHIPEGPAK